MKKEFVKGTLIFCYTILATVFGSAFTTKPGDENSINIILASDCYNMRIQDKKFSKRINSYSDSDCEGEKVHNNIGGFLEGLILAPTVITKTIDDNPAMLSKK